VKSSSGVTTTQSFGIGEEPTVRKNWLVLALVAGLVAACGGSAATGSLQASGTPAAGTQTGASQAAASATGTTAASGSATGSATGSAQSGPIACSLITTAEASAALGDTVAAGVAPVAGENTCVFSGPVFKLTSVQIAVIALAEFTPTQASVPSSFTVTQAPGIGDAAYYKKLFLPNTGGESLMEISVLKGQTAFTITVLDHAATDSTLMAAEKTLALAAVGRI
jgi:hypothetical protein